MIKSIRKAGIALALTSVLYSSAAPKPAQANGRGNAYMAAGAAGVAALLVWHPWNRGKGVHFAGGNSAYLPENAPKTAVSLTGSSPSVITHVSVPTSSSGGSTGMGSTNTGLKHVGADPGGTTSVTIGGVGAS